jgi:hypothetical protein
MYLYLAITTMVALLAFLAGLVTFKRSLSWCPGCGAELACPHRCGGHTHWQERRIGVPETTTGRRRG